MKEGISVKWRKKTVKIKSAFQWSSTYFIRLPAGLRLAEYNVGIRQAERISGLKKVKRLPIAAIKGPYLWKYFNESERARLEKESLAKLEKNIHDQVRLILSRRIPA